MMFLPRRFRIVLFAIVTPLQIGIILTGNYAFLNYLVLVLGFLLLDDKFLRAFTLRRLRAARPTSLRVRPARMTNGYRTARLACLRRAGRMALAWLVFSGFCLSWNFYATTAQLMRMLRARRPLPMAPIVALEPSRIAESYGLFAVMTRARYEIEFQGSNDGAELDRLPLPLQAAGPAQGAAASMRRTSRDSSGICGSPRSTIGAKTVLSSTPRNGC